MRQYVEDEKYQSVLRQARLYESSEVGAEPELGNLFPDYSFLYIHAGVTEDIKDLGISDRQTKNVAKCTELTEGINARKQIRSMSCGAT